ncbi:MAG: FtsW/RodA/SpoVE family cell cycle protein, partial [Psychromonas sp.]|nr:FtsW/RodA/SpoVE family cell cycle protein [Psychromonas sp.]
MIFWQVFINIGMIMGLLPVVGMPLPLVSYGGSSLITIALAVGLLLRIDFETRQASAQLRLIKPEKQKRAKKKEATNETE